jgi:hypothetical protein
VLDDLEALLATIPADLAPPLVIIHDTGPSASSSTTPTGRRPRPGSPTPARPASRPGGPPGSARRTAPVHRPAAAGHPRPDRTTTVLANLGAIGTLTVDGDPGQVTHPPAGHDLRGRHLPHRRPGRGRHPRRRDRPPDLDQLRTVDDPADEIAAAAAEADVVDEDRLPRLIVSTTRSCPHPAGRRRRFCAILRPGTPAPAGWTLTVDGDRGLLHLPDGTVERSPSPTCSPRSSAAELEQLAPDPDPPPHRRRRADRRPPSRPDRRPPPPRRALV